MLPVTESVTSYAACLAVSYVFFTFSLLARSTLVCMKSPFSISSFVSNRISLILINYVFLISTLLLFLLVFLVA